MSVKRITRSLNVFPLELERIALRAEIHRGRLLLRERQLGILPDGGPSRAEHELQAPPAGPRRRPAGASRSGP